MMTSDISAPRHPGHMPEPVKASAGSILIADDDTMVMTPLRKILMNRGYEVTCVTTGWDAAAELTTRNHDLLVADICMPGNMALDVLHAPEVKALQVPVILITGHPSIETAVDALRLSVVDYFVKPIVPETFLASIERAIVRKSAMRTVRELQQRVGDVSAVLESVKNTLEIAGQPLIGEGGGRYTNGRDPGGIRARLQTGDFAGLSRREREILEMIAVGSSTQTAAEQLGISVSTVRNHLKSIYRKVGVSSQVSLVRKLLT